MFDVIFWSVLIYIYVSVLYLIYCKFSTRNLNNNPLFGFINETLLLPGFFIGLWMLFYPGFEKALFFIPDNWTNMNEDGEIFSIKNGASMALSFAVSVYVLLSRDNLFKKRN
ncbi:hypothetical protein LX92_04322 [Maribacter polysiphoniae]|uniref:Uncharacterized protein n=1 Tax=Maribacter polysiphoniae TaxID=429344 RepID=A0A316DLE6_9FLAO|nr:hypothetical protein LX92_04322 [Maribacter polysiphoniae]